MSLGMIGELDGQEPDSPKSNNVIHKGTQKTVNRNDQ